METKRSSKETFPIRQFTINGLYGYKTLQFKTKGKTTVVVSENGSGKTTLLDALNNILNADLENLKMVDFFSIEIIIKVNNKLETFIIKKSELELVSSKEIKHKLPFHLIDFDTHYSKEEIIKIIANDENIDLSQNKVLETLYKDSDFKDKSVFKFFLQQLRKMILDNPRYNQENSSLKNLFFIKDYFEDFDCIYLPTYRRVEKVFLENHNVKDSNSWRHPYKKRATHNYDKITYGLIDVEEILAEISSIIERKSNVGYRELSATILEDLLSDKSLATNKKVPKLEDLKRFLNRVRSSTISENNDIIDELESFYNKKRKNDKEYSNTRYLNYFLSRLNTVIDETKEFELKIENFVNECNKYLNSSGDAKEILFDSISLKVKIKDCFTGKQIQLNDLSSGEKQVVSLMALLYLTTNKKNKIILIDEPELSLSLDWQCRILPDINKANSVSQIIAITHSPFIFNNELDAQATPLKIVKSKVMDNNYE